MPAELPLRHQVSFRKSLYLLPKFTHHFTSFLFRKKESFALEFIPLSIFSNTLGTINPVKEIVQKAHKRDIPVLVDGAQATPHLKIDVQDLDVDFYVFSGHKVYGPTGIGVLYGKEKWLNSMPPYQGGGEMISTVTFEKTTFLEPPLKFEAGTPAIVEVLGFGAALDYLNEIG